MENAKEIVKIINQREYMDAADTEKVISLLLGIAEGQQRIIQSLKEQLNNLETTVSEHISDYGKHKGSYE